MNNPTLQLRRGDLAYTHWLGWLANALILSVAALLAIRLRVTVPLSIGKRLSDHFHEGSWILVSTIAAGIAWLVIGAILRLIAQQHARQNTYQFRALMLGAVLSGILMISVFGDVSRLQVSYFLAISAFAGYCLIILPRRLRATSYSNPTSSVEDLIKLYHHRFSLIVQLKYQIRARYSQTLLGILWVFFEPLLMALVLSFALSTILGGSFTDEVPMICFLLSGLVFFNFFNNVIAKSAIILIANGSLIQQIYFPRETINLLLIGEALIDMMFAFVVLVLILLFYGIPITIYYLLIPIPVLLLICFTLGLSLVVSWYGLLIRDISQLVGVILRLLFYVTVFYNGEYLGRFTFLLYFNPLIGILQTFREIVLYARMPDFGLLLIPTAATILMLYLGYVLFKVNEDRFADYV